MFVCLPKIVKMYSERSNPRSFAHCHSNYL